MAGPSPGPGLAPGLLPRCQPRGPLPPAPGPAPGPTPAGTSAAPFHCFGVSILAGPESPVPAEWPGRIRKEKDLPFGAGQLARQNSTAEKALKPARQLAGGRHFGPSTVMAAQGRSAPCQGTPLLPRPWLLPSARAPGAPSPHFVRLIIIGLQLGSGHPIGTRSRAPGGSDAQ